jgi:3-phosphoglycerate kinase
MDKNKIEDGNRKIAEYLGGEVREIVRIQGVPTYCWVGEEAKKWRNEIIGIQIGECVLLENMRFHKEWKWIMPVLQKIAKEHTVVRMVMGNIGTYFHFDGVDLSKKKIYSEDPILSAWQGAISFIDSLKSEK